MARPYEYKGQIVWVGEIQTFNSGFQKRTFGVSPNPDDKNPDTVAFDLFGGKNDMTNDVKPTDVGLEAEVKFYTSSRKYEKNGKVSWFTGNRAVDVSIARSQGGNEKPKYKVPEPATPETTSYDDVADDMPF